MRSSDVCLSACVCVRSGRSTGVKCLFSKTVKATDLKFDVLVPRDSPDMTPNNFSKRGCGQSHVTGDPLNFWALNANNSKTVKATDLKLDKSLPRDSPDMTPKIFPKGGVAMVT